MNEPSETTPLEMNSPVQLAGVAPDEKAAIYGVLVRLSQKWGYPDNEEGAPEAAPSPEHRPLKEAAPEPRESEDALDKTVILSIRSSSPPHVVVPEAPPPEPPPVQEKDIQNGGGHSEWDEMEQTVIISKNIATPQSTEPGRADRSEKEENRDAAAWTSKEDAIWNDAAETIRIISRDLPEESDLDETLILGGRSKKEGKKKDLCNPAPETIPEMAPSREGTPEVQQEEDDIVLETVILKQGYYE